ncbi:MAG: ferritin-like domain-containing protein [Candidatus Brocadiia bacterium]
MSQDLIELLNQALTMEYSDVFLYPRHSEHFNGQPAISELFKNFSQMELRHADTLAMEIHRLGGQPEWDFKLLTGKKQPSEIVSWHLNGERNAISHYDKCIKAAGDRRLKEILSGIKAEEAIHQAALEKIRTWIK